MSEYWMSCLEESLEEIGCIDVLTKEQISQLSKSIEFASKMQSEICGYPGGQVDSKEPSELDRLKAALEREKNATFCEECKGDGRIIEHGPIHSSNTQCYECLGEGKIY